MSGSRDKILGRIREALRVERPAKSELRSAIKEGRHDHIALVDSNADACGEASLPWEAAPGGTTPFDRFLPRAAQTAAEQIDQFAAFSERLRTDFRQFDSVGSAGQFLASLATNENWSRVAVDDSELAGAVASHLDSSIPILLIGDGYDRHELECCNAAITGCECLVAQTGSVCVTAQNGGRALSVLPPHHLVIARRNQMLSDLPAAYASLAKKYSDAWPSFVCLITGPSRTGDIERILVLGAHGPKRLTVMLVP
ncbi:MAG: LutC/YkgG family protein [Verrucomicrobiales bacterium]